MNGRGCRYAMRLVNHPVLTLAGMNSFDRSALAVEGMGLALDLSVPVTLTDPDATVRRVRTTR